MQQNSVENSVNFANPEIVTTRNHVRSKINLDVEYINKMFDSDFAEFI